MSQLGGALFTTTQQKVLVLLYAQPEKAFIQKKSYATENGLNSSI